MDLRLLHLFGLALLACACARGDAAQQYLSSSDFRRQTLVDSLVNPANGYAQLRLEHYERDWSQLKVSNLKVVPVGEDTEPRALDLDDPQLGEHAFFRYPVQDWTGPGEHLVRVTYDSGLTGTSSTCATCHVRDGKVGLPSQLDRGWGPGLLDVTTGTGAEPVAISDLRPVRFLTHLHHDGNVKQTTIAVLAERIETLIITSHQQRARPPREVALALARYVWQLADTLPAPPAQTHPGAAAFARACGGCHDPAADFTGPPVPIERAGTDARVGRSAERGTGAYRVPSLRGVSTRGALLHDLSVPSLEALLDPSRTAGGHTFGKSLDAAARAAVLDYVRAL